ncbi:gamma-glutamylcyclotransferase [Sulfurimonas sp. NW15]|uniref:gamma-glutamylcyclotransferase family protein n=1 Tax=Sulfurimonas sp. NW15 TaxID=2922729 RepID=UPI003DAA37DA
MKKLEKEVFLFVYGSMKKNFRNHSRLENDCYIGNATTINMYNLHPANSFRYPYCIESEKIWAIYGELYKLTCTKIEDIDIYEGALDYYYRKKISVSCKEKNYNAFIYFKTNNTGIEKDISLNKWTTKFEYVGEKNDEFLEALRVALT